MANNLVNEIKEMKISNPKVALVHDWLYGGGAELVVEQLHKLYPDAPIYTSYCSDEWRKRLDDKVVTGYLQHWPFNKLRKYIPFLRILWFTRLKFNRFDLVISSSGAEAKGIKVPPGVLHINYCHAPTHYYWSRYDEYMKHPGFGALDWLARFGLKLFVGPLRKWDHKAAQRPEFMIANSTHIQAEITKYYGRHSNIIFPPVYIDRFQKADNMGKPRQGFLIAGRQTPYKKFDLAILACNKLRLPLVVLGDGPDHKRLKAMAGPTITFMGKVSDDVLEHEVGRAEAFIFPGLDDFGIAPVEAMASGTPVIAYKAGGALDYIQLGKNGQFFEDQTVESLAEVLQSFDPTLYNHAAINNFVQKFSAEEFRNNFIKFVDLIRK